MSFFNVIVGLFAGILLADHYKIDRVKSVLASVILGFINVWVFLHLTVRKGWSTGKAVGAIVIAWVILLWTVLMLVIVSGGL